MLEKRYNHFSLLLIKDYSPLIIFFSRFNSSSISSRSEPNPPPALGATVGAGGAVGVVLPGGREGAAPGGAAGLFANVGAEGGLVPGGFGGPVPEGALGGEPGALGIPPPVGGNIGAGGKPGRLGGPPLGALGGPELGAFGGPPPPEGGAGAEGIADAEVAAGRGIEPEAATGAPVLLNRLNKVLAAAVLAPSLVGATIFLEEVLTV